MSYHWEKFHRRVMPSAWNRNMRIYSQSLVDDETGQHVIGLDWDRQRGCYIAAFYGGPNPRQHGVKIPRTARGTAEVRAMAIALWRMT